MKGLFVIEPEIIADDRGFFARAWTPEEFEDRGLNARVAQCSISFNTRRGTLRGMHFQTAPHEEAKLVRCTRGAIFDVAVDIRPRSPTLYSWVGVDLSADNHRMLYIPEGFAHGYQTLDDVTEISYQVSESYRPESARGLRWDDPSLNIEWPLRVTAISDRDRHHPLIEAAAK